MRGLGFAPAAIAEAVHAADRDGDGELDFDEFLALVVACTAAAGGSLPSAPLDAESFAVVATSHHVHSLVESFNPARDGPIAAAAGPPRRHAARRRRRRAAPGVQRPDARASRPATSHGGGIALPPTAPTPPRTPRTPRSPRSPPPRSPPSPRTRHRSPPRTAAAALSTIDGGGGARAPWASPRPTDMAMGETAKPKGRAPRAHAAATKLFSKIDADGNEKISRTEMMQHLLKGQDAGKIDRIFARLDVNADSSVTLEEWHRAIDANNDGRISAEEYKAFLSSTVSPKDATDAAMRRAAARATALAPAERAAVRQKWLAAEGVFENLEARGFTGQHTELVRGSWLMRQRGKPLPKRPLPREGIIGVGELRRIHSLSDASHGGVPVVAVSHVWRTRRHPDPTGETLTMVIAALESLWLRCAAAASPTSACSSTGAHCRRSRARWIRRDSTRRVPAARPCGTGAH